MSIQYTKTPEDIRLEQFDLESNRTLKHLRDLNFYKFNVGDLLIREDKYGKDATWKVKMAECGLPYKYVYVFENELGIGYIRRLSIHGDKFVDAPICVVNFDPTETRFSLDPGYADHLMLGDAPFDLKADFKAAKKKRDRMYRENDKIVENTDTQDDVIALLKRLKAGDQVWTGWSRATISKQPYSVVRIHFDQFKDKTYVELAHPYSTYRNRIETVNRIVGQLWFLSRPLFLDEIL